ncbi:MAG: arylamine N-acetyltransferase [Synergistaceae bacterium]|jgi:N-hydroxyarylamine O-acetyltransferase|nr:arylamine N-acetyltransferase [Synergistaceae bacterium]
MSRQGVFAKVFGYIAEGVGVDAPLYDRTLIKAEAAEYLRRIGLDRFARRLSGESGVCWGLAELNAMILAHQHCVPFENLDTFLYNRVPSLRTDDLFDKIVMRRRGGWCFELNSLFFSLISATGYSVTAHTADVCRSGAFASVNNLSAHRVNLVRIDDKAYFCDVGFGGTMPGFAVEWRDYMPESGAGGVFFFEPGIDGHKTLVHMSGKTNKALLRVGPKPFRGEDFLEANRYTALSGESRFNKFRLAYLKKADGLLRLKGDELILERDGAEEKVAVDESKIRYVLGHKFGIRLD